MEFLKNKICYYKDEKVEFIKLYEKNYVLAPSLLIGGHDGGKVSVQMATILYQGKIIDVDPYQLTFKESEVEND